MKKLILALLVALPLSAMAQKFAHFSSADIIPLMPEYTAAQTEVQNASQQYEDELKKMQEELQTKYEDYQQNAATMVDAVRQRRESELQDLQTRLQEYYTNSQQELQQLQQTRLSEISERITKVVKEIGEAGGYVYIMDTTSGIPYISTTLSTDITSQIKSKLGL